MELNPEICERARLSRDARFDGRFFIGVKTTGIYCRPICPVKAPKAKNVRFYPSAAAAAEAGFRPCLRCRPEASPGTPAWLGTSATVSRGLRLIGEGALDEGGVEELAERVGMGGRQLRRLFIEHLGASPIAVAQTRRLHFAKKLIDESDLPMAEIAFSSGFGSVRRFNATFAATYGRTPKELRKRRRKPAEQASSFDDGLRLLVPYRPPFDWNSLVDFLAVRATAGVEAVDRKAYRRTISIDGKSGSLAVRPAEGTNALELSIRFPDSKAYMGIVEGVRRIFDLRADPAEISARLSGDPRLAASVASHPGLRVPGAWDGFELTVRAILGQQVSVKGATTLAGRLARAYGTPVEAPADSDLSLLFPTPLALRDADLGEVGLPAGRAEALRNLAAAVRDGRVSFDASMDLDAFVGQLAGVRGIGEWTAQYVAMRVLGEPDAFPATDLVLLKAASDGGTTEKPKALLALAEPWRPWRAYAAMHLWKAYAGREADKAKKRRTPKKPKTNTPSPAAKRKRTRATRPLST